MNKYKTARLEVAKLINVKVDQITSVLYDSKIENLYITFEIPKKSGGVRIISTPKDSLKCIQRNLAKELNKIHLKFLKDNNIKASISHGFEKNKSIITNAYIHKSKRYLVNIDISDFFPSFHFGRVKGYFCKSKEFGFSEEVSTIIAQLVCYNGTLPQGDPTSPTISNLIFNIVDLQILKLAKKYRLSYTRYADDLSFSTNDKSFKEKYEEFLAELDFLINKNDFKINGRKTRFEYCYSRQEVTGLTVNKKLNANKVFIDKTRAMANSLYKNNVFTINSEDGNIKRLEGRFAFINQLDRFNNQIEYEKTKKEEKCKFIAKLNSRERQYQYFLFYKYFYRPEKPIIVTEGKTDILHLKAALMKLHEDYPKLISLENGRYKFKISFLNKNKRLKYFLGIVEDGADTMRNIWNFYTGKNGCKNIYTYLDKKRGNINEDKINPVFLLFDNEQQGKKPLKGFLNFTNTEIDEGKISKNLKANLYLQTIPLPNDKEECEIEDLYQKDILDIKIKGKKFSRDDNYSPEKYFGKNSFALYVKKNYQKIDFSGFRGIFDSISELI